MDLKTMKNYIIVLLLHLDVYTNSHLLWINSSINVKGVFAYIHTHTHTHTFDSANIVKTYFQKINTMADRNFHIKKTGRQAEKRAGKLE